MSQKISPKLLLIGLALIALVGIAMISYSASNAIKNVSPTPPVSATVTPFNAGFVPMTTPVQDTPVSGQIIVKFKPQYDVVKIENILKPYHANIIKKIDGIDQTVIQVPLGQEETIIQQLQKAGYTESAQRDYTTHTLFVPNDEGFSSQWGLNNTGQAIKGSSGKANADIRIESAWDVTKGAGIKVAILDTGINLNHPDLAGKVVAQKSFTTATVEDNNGHGTHVAGIIAANTDNTVGVAGTCPDCQLIIGKVMDDDGTGTTSDATAGITWAADQGAKVINMSIGTDQADTATLYQQAINYATQKGAIVVAAAGNSNNTIKLYPAAISGVISVAATDNQDQKAYYSDYGTWVQVAAPGTNILSTLPTHANKKNVLNYGYDSGTSMAGPYVAGVAALVASTSYGTTPDAIANRIYTTADKISGTGTYWVKGRVNASNAVGANVTSTEPSFTCVGGAAVPPCATIPPTIYSLGGSITPTSMAISPTTANPSITSAEPSSQTTVAEPSSQITTTPEPTITNTSSQNPCAVSKTASATTTQSAYHWHHRHHRGGFLNFFFKFFLQLLYLLLQKLGISPPCSSASPTATVTPTPSIAPTPMLSSTPSTSASPASSVSPTVAQSETTTITPTSSDLPVLTGPFGNSCVPGHLYCNGHVITSGTANTLYLCEQNQSPTVSKQCATSCTVNTSGDDACAN